MKQGGGAVRANTRSQIYSGRVRNLRNTINQEKIIKRWTNSVIKGYPFSVGKSRFSFLLCPQNGEQTQRVALYGDAAGSSIKEGETIFVTGKKNKDGIIIGEQIYEPNIDKHIQAERVFSSNSIRIAMALIFMIAAYMVFLFTKSIINGIPRSLLAPTKLLRFIVIFILAVLCLKSRTKTIRTIGWILMGLGISMIYPPIVIIVILFFALKWMLR